MRKFLFIILALTWVSLSSAQQDNYYFEDGSFENKWEKFETGRSDFPFYWDYSLRDEEDLLRTLNSLTDINIGEFITEPTAFRVEDDVVDGNYAIKLTTAKFSNQLLVPGAFGTISNTYINEYLGDGSIGVVAEFDQEPKKLTGYYKYLPVNGDSAVIEVELFDYDFKIASGVLKIYETVSEWTPFEIEIVNTVPGANVTDLRLLFISSAGYNFDDLMECKGHVGSSLFIDNIQFSYESGLKENIISDVKVNIFPNPATETVTLTFDRNLSGNLVIYNLLGAEIATYPMNGERMDINVTSFEAGTYLFRVIDQNQISKSGKFVVQ